jgi:hypothetical protein
VSAKCGNNLEGGLMVGVGYKNGLEVLVPNQKIDDTATPFSEGYDDMYYSQ